MVDTLQRIADLEAQPDRKSKYLYTMAQLYRDKLDDQLRAVDLFNEALDLNPGFLEAFERINKILTALKEWKQLERAYRKMLHRVAGKGNLDLEFSLWHALGLIYRDRLADLTAGVEAFRMASRIKPEDPQEHLILAELHERLHRIPAPPGIRAAPLPGDRLVHRDLHPMNVLMTPDGPVVIDWANASAGDPAFDVADTWVLFACGTPPMGGIDRFIVPIGRRILLRSFLSRVDTVAARRAIPAAVDHRLTDRNMSAEEHARMRKLAAWASNV